MYSDSNRPERCAPNHVEGAPSTCSFEEINCKIDCSEYFVASETNGADPDVEEGSSRNSRESLDFVQTFSSMSEKNQNSDSRGDFSAEHSNVLSFCETIIPDLIEAEEDRFLTSRLNHSNKTMATSNISNGKTINAEEHHLLSEEAENVDVSFLVDDGSNDTVKIISDSSDDDDDGTMDSSRQKSPLNFENINRHFDVNDYLEQSIVQDKDEDFICKYPDCGAILATKYNKLRHEKEVHQSLRIKCPKPDCESRIKISGLRKHLKHCHDEVFGQPISQIESSSPTESTCSDIEPDQQNTAPLPTLNVSQAKSTSPYICEKCGVIFTASRYLSRHKRRVHTSLVKCPFKYCTSVVKPGSLKTHIRGTHEKAKRQCKKCKKFITIYGFACHIKSCAKKKTHQPLLVTSDHIRNDSHRDDNLTENEIIEQPICEILNETETPIEPDFVTTQSVQTDADLYQNVDTRAVEKKFSCPYEKCDATFATNIDRRTHLSSAHRLPVKCPYENCNLFIEPCNLNTHIKETHDYVEEQCSNCNLWIPSNTFQHHLDNCLRVQENVIELYQEKSAEVEFVGLKPFNSSSVKEKQCKNCRCPIIYSSDDYCDKCKKWEKMLLCPDKKCTSRFKSSKNLKRHMSEVHALRKKCPYENCHSYVKNLDQHIKSKHQKIKKQCSNCQKWVPFLSLQGHFERCTSDGEKRYPCTFGCGAKFTTISNRASHISLWHRKKKVPQVDDYCVVLN